MRVLGYRRASPGRVTGPCWAAGGRATGEVLSSRRQPQGAVARHLGLWTRPPGPRALFVLMLGRSRWQATTPRVGWGEPLSEPRGQVTGRTTPRAHRVRARKARGRRVRAGRGVAARTAPAGLPPAALSPAVGRPPLHTRSCPRGRAVVPGPGHGVRRRRLAQRAPRPRCRPDAVLSREGVLLEFGPCRLHLPRCHSLGLSGHRVQTHQHAPGKDFPKGHEARVRGVSVCGWECSEGPHRFGVTSRMAMRTRLTLERRGASGRTVPRGGEPACPACPAAGPAPTARSAAPGP